MAGISNKPALDVATEDLDLLDLLVEKAGQFRHVPVSALVALVGAAADGADGWTPEPAVETDGARRVVRILSWSGGEGDAPATGYLGPGGVVATAAEATDIRGAAGTGSGDMAAATYDPQAIGGDAFALGSHTGTLPSSRISDFSEAVMDAVAALLGEGSNITLTYDDEADQLTITSTGGGTTDPEAVRDAIGVALVGAGPISVGVDDEGDTITISTSATQNSTDAALRDRGTHTGEQAIATVTGLQAALDAKAPLASPALTGTPTAPTAPEGDDSTRVATTAYVDRAVANGGGGAGPASTRLSGGNLAAVRAALAGNPHVLFVGDSYVNTGTDRVPYQFAKEAAAQGLVDPIRGLYLTNAQGNANWGGFYLYATGTGHKLLNSADGYAAVGGAERVGLPTWMNEVHVTNALNLSTDGRLCYFRLETGGTDTGGAGSFLTAAEGAADTAVLARIVGYAPETPGALLGAALGIRDRASGAPNEATVTPATGAGLPDGVPPAGSFYRFPDVTLDNATSSPAWYGALVALDGEAAGAAPNLDEYLHLAGCWVRRPDRATGPMVSCLGEASWGYEGWSLDLAPTAATGEQKRVRTDKLTTWLAASRVDVDQPLVVVLHLNNEVVGGTSNASDVAAKVRAYVSRIRRRWIEAAGAAGYGDVRFLFVHGWAQGSIGAVYDDGILDAIRREVDVRDDSAYVSLKSAHEDLLLAGSTDAVDFLEREGEAALAAGGGDLLDDEEVHPASAAAANLFARQVLALLYPS